MSAVVLAGRVPRFAQDSIPMDEEGATDDRDEDAQDQAGVRAPGKSSEKRRTADTHEETHENDENPCGPVVDSGPGSNSRSWF